MVRLQPVINRANFGACYIYIYIRTKVTRCICVNCTFVSEPLNHIRQDMKSARLTAVCEGSFIGPV